MRHLEPGRSAASYFFALSLMAICNTALAILSAWLFTTSTLPLSFVLMTVRSVTSPYRYSA